MDAKRRSYDIYDIEERVHALELGGGDTPTPGGGSWDYSTEEVDTNQKWTDGKEIYCKVFHFASPVAINGNSNVGEFSTVSINDLDTLVDVHAIGTSGAQGYKYTFGGSAWYEGSGFGLKIAGFTVSGSITDVIVYYTKSTTTKTAKRSSKT